MSDDVNPLAPAEDAEQEESTDESEAAEAQLLDESAAGDDAEILAKEEEAAPAEQEPARAVDQRHPNPEHLAKLQEPTP